MAFEKRNTLLTRISGDSRFDSHRVFHLHPEETLELRKCKAGDYLAASQGSAWLTISAPQGDERHRLVWNRRPLVLSTDAKRITVKAEEDLVLHKLDQETLDYLIALDGISTNLRIDHSPLLQRLNIIGHCPSFRAIPIEHIQEIAAVMYERCVSDDEEITTEGRPGDAFYVIAEGAADVFQMDLDGDEVRRINALRVGDGFGEAALVTGKNRTATVRMATAGKLLVLEKADFERLISRPLIRKVSAKQARTMMDKGFGLLDVRYEEELEFEGSIPGSRLLPLEQLHKERDDLDQSGSYVVYCASGQRSAIGALLLAERGIDAVSLDGGINNWPYEKLEPIA